MVIPSFAKTRLTDAVLHKIAFQYYPLDLSATSNPFLISWWPLALGDPALFHVSLQTACLDQEVSAQRGFQTSNLLMADSVALLRRKVEDTSLAVQDGTMNSVITLAAIEFGKGNVKVGEMHVAGLRRLVALRGGINSVRQTSPLTARMVSWYDSSRLDTGPQTDTSYRVSMLIMGFPQFETQDDMGIGDGIPPIPEWQLDAPALDQDILQGCGAFVDTQVENVFARLRNVFQRAQQVPLTPTKLHDLTCLVVHRLLSSSSTTIGTPPSPLSECIRCAIILYMLIIQGPTYYTHAAMSATIAGRLAMCHGQLESTLRVHGPLDVWCMAVGMVASAGTPSHGWFVEKARKVAEALRIQSWEGISDAVKRVLWLETTRGEDMFRAHWDVVWGVASHPEPPDAVSGLLPTSADVASFQN